MFIEENTLKNVMETMSKVELKNTKSDYIEDGKRVPRVTEILSSMIHNDGLMGWSNSLGWKRISYRAFMKDAADKGTYSHLAIEKFIKQGYVNLNDLNIPNENILNTVSSCIDGFTQWWNKIHKEYNVIKLIYIEETLIHPYFGGTCDCLLKVDGKYWLIDFKTSNHMNYTYTLQLAAYRFLLKQLKGIEIDKAMVLRVDKVNRSYDTYELDMNNKDHLDFINECEQTFMMIAAAFRMREVTTDKYYNIFNLKKYR